MYCCLLFIRGLRCAQTARPFLAPHFLSAVRCVTRAHGCAVSRKLRQRDDASLIKEITAERRRQLNRTRPGATTKAWDLLYIKTKGWGPDEARCVLQHRHQHRVAAAKSAPKKKHLPSIDTEVYFSLLPSLFPPLSPSTTQCIVRLTSVCLPRRQPSTLSSRPNLLLPKSPFARAKAGRAGAAALRTALVPRGSGAENGASAKSIFRPSV